MLVSPSFPPTVGGIERTAGELAARLTGYSVEVVAGRPISRSGMRPPTGIDVHWARNEPPYGRRATFALLRLAVRVGLRFRPQVVLATHIRGMAAARALQRVCGARTILVVHAKEVLEQPALARAAVRWADAIVCVSDFSRSLALGAGADQRRISIVNPGVTLPENPPPLALRPGPATVVTVARMDEPYKGHDIAIEAMARLRDSVPDAQWIMIGEGDLRGPLERTARARGLDGAISFPGAVDDGQLASQLAAAHAFCLLSRRPDRGAGEGFGIAFVEAGAHGLPVVAGRSPGVVDAVQDGISGLLVDPCDPDEVAASLARVLREGNLAQRLADGGRRRAEQLEWTRVVHRYRELIDSALERPPAARSHREVRWAIDLARGPQPPR
jgi:phosphatidyl-myo-inositol dimannoside synthase